MTESKNLADEVLEKVAYQIINELGKMADSNGFNKIVAMSDVEHVVKKNILRN